MESYTFSYDQKAYTLSEENCLGIFMDESITLEITENDVLKMLGSSSEPLFYTEYFKDPCEECGSGESQHKGVYEYLEYHFYVYVKDGKLVGSNISNEFGDTGLKTLERKGLVDTVYIAGVIVCKKCGHFMIDLELCDF